MTKNIFPLEKILTVSATDFANSKGLDLSSYHMVGIHSVEERIIRFAKLVPKNAEIVVGYAKEIAATSTGTGTAAKTHFKYNQVGTALILKDETDRKKWLIENQMKLVLKNVRLSNIISTMYTMIFWIAQSQIYILNIKIRV